MTEASQAIRIFVVDDEAALRSMVAEYLSELGYAVTSLADGASLRRACEQEAPHIVLVDLRMPGEDGLSVIRFLRESYGDEVGLIMLTAIAEPVDRVIGLEVGADDYIAKPYDPRELAARIKQLLRRLPMNQQAASDQEVQAEAREVMFGYCRFNITIGELYDRNGEPISLTAMEVELLRAFAASPNRALSRDHLLNAAHGRDWNPYDRSIDSRIVRLRKKIEADPHNPKIIRTVHGRGYQFVVAN